MLGNGGQKGRKVLGLPGVEDGGGKSGFDVNLLVHLRS